MTATTTPAHPAGRADWSRAEWIAFADRLLAGTRRWASPGNARITPPGAEGGYGNAVDGLEGFARTFLLAGFRIAGERGEGLDDLIDFYAKGISTGVDPASADRWVRPEEHAQAKVEAASIAVILDMTRPWVWDRLDQITQERVIRYLSAIVGDTTYPRNNWLWFRIVVETFLRSVGGPWSAQDIADDLARHDSYVRADGWIADGEDRAFDHYTGWALHLYPVLWSRMQGAADLAGGRLPADVARLDRYLQDAVALVGADGSPLIQGRSLIYRFAAAAPFWAGIIADVPSTSAGRLRHAADLVVRHFADAGAPDERDLLTMGWHGEWRRLAQSYSGPASPYWATKGMLGISLPADHPVWAAPSEPLPVETGDDLRIVRAAGWLVSGTRADGIVRVVNHGTDHAQPGSDVGDSPIYTRLAYSTATAPLHAGRAWREPLEQSAALTDENGRSSHRAGMELLGNRIDGDVAVGGSVAAAHWIDPADVQTRHGSGIAGDVTPAGRILTISFVRGPWEARLVRVDELHPAACSLRIGGWPLATGSAPTAFADGSTARVAIARGDGELESSIRLLVGAGEPAVVERDDASPLGLVASVPVIELDAAGGEWVVVLVGLDGARTAALEHAAATLAEDQVSVTWPDDVTTTHDLTLFRSASLTDR
ncbi:DUF2264 domain-containing protein [Microbacterium sp. ASV49]|uniref:DUF2264 domain-containing protein n=1 Tax=Microbacterium candidum TaxID=3041922 RepID=A0ABT7MXP5_9MICO|nr:DUF2264 domain-containing protein [Microbacterium sp. ASV49]MDL9979214.1 DUF2264 domain-containing protein [Microbacterium sp. ASV49]